MAGRYIKILRTEAIHDFDVHIEENNRRVSGLRETFNTDSLSHAL